MKETFLNTPEDLEWLFSTHLKGKKIPASPKAKSAMLYGNEDAPNKVVLFSRKMPRYDDNGFFAVSFYPLPYRSNPRSRRSIPRAGIPARKYLGRPSQITRGKPSRRLAARRKVNLARGREGFFPNPKIRVGSWHQRRQPIEVQHEILWTVLQESPIGAGIMRFETEKKAQANVEGMKVHHPDTKTTIFPPLKEPMRKNPARKSREIITITGKKSGLVLGYAPLEMSRAALGRAALLLANQHLEPVKVERKRLAARGLPENVQAYLNNPTPRAAVESAARRFTRFTGHRAERVENLPFPAKPKAGLAVGPVVMLGYTATRDGKRNNYLHKFAPHARPMLVSSDDGKSLFLLGGRYKFTERGIVDQRK